MSPAISDNVRTRLSRSLPLVEQRKESLVNRMEANLRAGESDREPYGQSEVVAMILVDLLLAQARNLAEKGEMADLRDVKEEHRALDISGRHYSRFGDALVPILRDLLGPRLPREVASAWCDAFWAVIAAAQSRGEPAYA
jgi:hemoglobin-like flavoprotein